MKKTKFLLLSAFFCAGMLLVTACNKDDEDPVANTNNTEQSNNTEQNNNTVSVSGVTLDKTSVSLEVGATLTLTATVSPDNATNKTITWSSSDDAIATVDENGKVTAVAAGTVTITAKAGDKTAECKVTVSAKVIAVESITFDESSLSLPVGDSKTLTATVSPENADNKTVTWSSSDEAIATVDENGKVTAVTAGTATIKATANDGSEVFGSCAVTVSLVAVTSITLNKTTTKITVGGTETLSVTSVLPANATDKTYTWSSSDETIATVDANGKVTAVAVGTATIKATANDDSGVKDECTVTVKNPVKLADAFENGAVVNVRFTLANHNATVTGTYNGNNYANVSCDNTWIPEQTASLSKSGNNIIAYLSNFYGDMTITFDATNNTYTITSAGGRRLGAYYPTGLEYITVNDEKVNVTQK